jgi:hypothetical protein
VGERVPGAGTLCGRIKKSAHPIFNEIERLVSDIDGIGWRQTLIVNDTNFPPLVG